MNYYNNTDLLAHHGVKGQRWGVRRFENEDGSLTAAGERHYYKKDGSLKRRGKKYYLKEYKKKAYDYVHKQLDAKYGKDKWVTGSKSLADQNRLYGKAFDDINAYKRKLDDGYVPVKIKNMSDKKYKKYKKATIATIAAADLANR